MRKTVGELLGFLAGKDSGTEIEIFGTINDDGTGTIYVGSASFDNY